VLRCRTAVPQCRTAVLSRSVRQPSSIKKPQHLVLEFIDRNLAATQLGQLCYVVERLSSAVRCASRTTLTKTQQLVIEFIDRILAATQLGQLCYVAGQLCYVAGQLCYVAERLSPNVKRLSSAVRCAS
jgi:hypothetical protein